MLTKKLIIFIISGVAIFGLGAGAVAISLYTQTWDPLWNPFRPEPEEVIERMIENMENLKSFSLDTKFNLEVSNREEFDLSFEVKSDEDYHNSEIPKLNSSFYGTFAVEGTQFSLAGESKIIGEISYFKLTIIPAFPFLQPMFAVLGLNLEELKNQWIKVDKESYKKLNKKLMGEAYTLELERRLEESKREQLEMIEKLKEISAVKKLYLVKEELPDEKIGGKKVYHYLVALNQEEIKNLLPELFEAFAEKGSIPVLTGEDLKRIQEEFDKLFEKLGEVKGEIWISKKEELLYKVKGKKEIDMRKFTSMGKGKVTFGLEASFSNFNQPMTIKSPEEFKTIDEVFKIRRNSVIK